MKKKLVLLFDSGFLSHLFLFRVHFDGYIRTNWLFQSEKNTRTNNTQLKLTAEWHKYLFIGIGCNGFCVWVFVPKQLIKTQHRNKFSNYLVFMFSERKFDMLSFHNGMCNKKRVFSFSFLLFYDFIAVFCRNCCPVD